MSARGSAISRGLFLAWMLASAGLAGAHDVAGPVALQTREPSARIAIPDVQLLDQDGRSIRFYQDLIKGKVVAIHTVYTSCTTTCPLLAATFAALQASLGDRLGEKVRLISISVDPATDTPERLKRWGEKFGMKPGWTLVTGQRGEVVKLLRALGAYSAKKEEHPPLVLVGNTATGLWTRAYGLVPASRLSELIESAINGDPGVAGR
ncbi:MAG TPA: SCO family protein [Methylomirabilota bacterium]|nr:SCO family protein [Methylomirabilota bacterium]